MTSRSSPELEQEPYRKYGPNNSLPCPYWPRMFRTVSSALEIDNLADLHHPNPLDIVADVSPMVGDTRSGSSPKRGSTLCLSLNRLQSWKSLHSASSGGRDGL
ncbi:hypothetical protein ARMGADRAFT_324876 [Armillaria gallica]|uniref:Uncharacterized protein n=1 Tax=Armillaria gallica TaxID=47427 RepID=A0A2H3DFA3_ARMGA|nr:hypothetical protein ARMGADRAFT_324876 [Armillaria gallica]